MSMNLGTYALVSALALGGAVARYQYSRPAGPPDPNSTGQQQTSPVPNGYSSTPMGTTTTGPVDCSTLMGHHQQMMTDIDNLDRQLNTQLSQMHDAKSDRAKLEATMGVVDTLVNQRKQERDHMMRMEHETLQFLLTNKDANASCPQLSQWLEQGASMNADTANTTEQGGPDDGEIYNNGDNTITPDTTAPSTSPDNNNGTGRKR